MELVGRTVRKKFPGFGTYNGVVESYDVAAGYFKVLYEDGDSEEVDFEEIASLLMEMGEQPPTVVARRSNRGRRPKKRRRAESNQGDARVVDDLDEVLDKIVMENGVLLGNRMCGGLSNGFGEKDCSQGFERIPESMKLEENGNLVSSAKENGSFEGRTDTLKEKLVQESCHLNIGVLREQEGDCNCGTVKNEQGPRKRRKISETVTPLRRSARRANVSLLSPRDDVIYQVEKRTLSYEEGTDLGGRDNGCGSEDSKPKLPPSSNDLDLEGLAVLDLFSVYAFLRSFSRPLFLSPFRLETFISALRCKFANSLIDSIHFSILQTLKRHLEFLSEEGSQSATDCIRYLNWELLDLVTWPLYLAEYLLVHGSAMKSGIRLTHLKLMNMEYYKQPAAVKLDLLRCLCDDVIEAEAIRSELNSRMNDSELNMDTHRNCGRKRNDAAMKDLEGCSDAEEASDDGNSDECCLCGMDGSLICCDGCPAAFHSRCVGVAKDLLPEGDWYCPDCLIEKSDELVKLSNPCRGAQILGIDPHGRLYFSSCGYLLVSDLWDTTTSCHYYSKGDLHSVMEVLKSSHHSYTAIVGAISESWGIPVQSFKICSQYENENHNEEGVLNTHLDYEHLSPLKQELASDEVVEKIPKLNSASPEHCDSKNLSFSDFSHSSQVISYQPAGITSPSVCSETVNEMTHASHVQKYEEIGVDCSKDSDVPDKEVVMLKSADIAIGNNECIGLAGRGGTSLIREQKKGASQLRSDPSAYMNYFSFGRIASSLAEELMCKSSESNNMEVKKSVEDIMSIQLRAISKKSVGFCCYTYQKLSLDAEKEKCGWCLSCKNSSDSDCLVKVTDERHLANSKLRNVGVRSEKNKKSHIVSAIHYILFMEDHLHGLLSGPWQNPQYRNLWRKAVLKSLDVASLKNHLLMLESNLRRVALSAEWLKSVDSDHAVGSASLSLASSSHISSSNGSSKKQGKKPVPGGDTITVSTDAISSDMYWWRGGTLSRQVFHWKLLPRSLASRSGRQAGCKKILSIIYPDGSEVARRSKCIAWRAAVEMSESVPQLIFQIKELDSNIKWAEMLSSQPFPSATREPKNLLKLFKKVIIRRKCTDGVNVKYLLDFGKRVNMPPVVARHGVMHEEPSSERKKYWLSDGHVPLYLLKAFEEKKLARLLKRKDSGLPEKINLYKSKKPKRSNGLSHLLSKARELESEICGHCNNSVLISEAVNCQHCKGFFHRKHFRVPKSAVTTTYTCFKCKDNQIVKVKRKGRKVAQKKKRKNPTRKRSQRISKKRKHVVVKVKKKPDWRKKSKTYRPNTKKGQLKKSKKESKNCQPKKSESKSERAENKSKNIKPEVFENDLGWRKRKRTVVHHSYWLNGLRWTYKGDDEQGKCFRRRVLLPSQHIETSFSEPVCCLCRRDYNSDVIFICCEKCEDWFHGDVYGVTLENVSNLIGFKCDKCRMRSTPTCPYLQNAEVDKLQSDIELTVGEPVCNKDQNGQLKLHDRADGDSQGVVCTEDFLDEERKDDNIMSSKIVPMPSETGSTDVPIAILSLKQDEENTLSCRYENGPQILVTSQGTRETSEEIVVVSEVLVAGTIGHSATTSANNSISTTVG
ncbi:DDT domain-containing protein PTM [Typha angustifolia]|uniref:DDT domain-containing protein PTM n=1 Tax=Typha angustifolia TaxID=59011 RepID=UPI003C2E697C